MRIGRCGFSRAWPALLHSCLWFPEDFPTELKKKNSLPISKVGKVLPEKQLVYLLWPNYISCWIKDPATYKLGSKENIIAKKKGRNSGYIHVVLDELWNIHALQLDRNHQNFTKFICSASGCDDHNGSVWKEGECSQWSCPLRQHKYLSENLECETGSIAVGESHQKYFWQMLSALWWMVKAVFRKMWSCGSWSFLEFLLAR